MQTKTLEKPGTKKPALEKAMKKLPKQRLSKKPMQSLEISSPENFPEIEKLDKLNLIAEHWLSDLHFFEDEIRFLHSLINKYFMWLTEDDNISGTKGVARELALLEKQRITYEGKIQNHIRTYRNWFENPFSHDRDPFQRQHAQLEKNLAGFVKAFRSIKKRAFLLTEAVIQSEKIKHLLTSRENSE
jgi:hypothetical protein